MDDLEQWLTPVSLSSGFEQANRYVILDAHGNHVGYMAEEEKGMGSMLSRQWLHTHRPFVTHVFDRNQNEVLRVSVFDSYCKYMLLGLISLLVSQAFFLDQFYNICV